MKNLFDLGGKVAVITGSTLGIGRAIAEAYAEHGAKVVISSRKPDMVEKVTEEIRAAGGEAIGIPCNIGHREQLEQLFAKAREKWGRIDILVSNAAVNPYAGPALDCPDDAFERIMKVNIQANMWMVKLVAPEMRARRDGAIIIVSSIGGLRGSSVLGAYCISKAADMQIARNLAVELGPDNIRVNCIAPGLVTTNFARILWEDPNIRAKREAETPLRRVGHPDDLAGIAVYLGSRAGSWTTGQTFVVDGGVTAAGQG